MLVTVIRFFAVTWMAASSINSLPAADAQAGGNNKVDICNIPAGNPDNFKTISVNKNAVDAHLANGDLLGSCSLYCEELCDDSNECTIDECVPGEDECLPESERTTKGCDDSVDCTEDSCDPSTGLCIHTPDDTACSAEYGTPFCVEDLGCVQCRDDNDCDPGCVDNGGSDCVQCLSDGICDFSTGKRA
jgi:Dictyostelium (slime mold) repeat